MELHSPLIPDSKPVSPASNKSRTIIIAAAVISIVVVLVFCLSYFLIENEQAKYFERNTRVSIDGGIVQGYKVGGVALFKGIPYAKPPVEKRRWSQPEPCRVGDCWNGIFNATQFGEMCFQTDPLNRNITKGREDCLFINVVTPSSGTKEKLPVLVFIHGGSLIYGSGNKLGLFPNPELVSELKIVGVSFNYRLNAFGFLALDALAKLSFTSTSGNYGFMDQILALKWVQDNIGKFGGDPNRVTLLGQSSGGTSELALLSSPLAKGLFHGVIMMSASAIYNKSAGDASRDNEIFLKNCDCQKADINSTLKCLFNLSAKQIVDAVPWDVYPYWAMENQQDLPSKGLFDGAIAVVDGYLVPQPPLDAMATGRANDVPLIVGTTAQEIGFPQLKMFKSMKTFRKYAQAHLEPFLGLNKTIKALNMYPGTAQYSFLTLGSDIVANCPDDVIALKASQGFRSTVYRYVVTNSPSEPVHVDGFYCQYAFHMWDLIAFFGFPHELDYKPSERDMAFMRDLRRELGTFIHHRRVYDKSWRDYPDGTALFTNSGVEILTSRGYHEKECSFWMKNGFFPYAWIN